jgi:serine/threonine-protein kinase
MADATEHDDDQELPSILPDTVIGGKYRIEKLIGRGGMGSVWAAVHLGLGQRVAIKLIARRYANSREARHRFDLEAKAAAQLRSRFVVQVYDNGETSDGTPYIVMELLEGESLDERIQRQGPLPVDVSLRILGQVARALGRAHAVGIVHRDLKPENIFLTHSQDDEGEIAKVLDFGIAKIKTPEGTDSATRTGAVLGTPLFMSPEQARALRSVDHRTDIYSFGIVAYTMMTGTPAFTGESFGDILVAICTQPLPSMRAIAPWLPAGIDEWLGRTCAREPAQRYISIEHTLEGLITALGVSRSALSSQELPKLGSSGLERPAPVRAGAAPVAPTQVESAALPHERRTTSGLIVSGADIPKRSLAPALILLVACVVLGGVGAIFVLRRPSSAAPEQVGKVRHIDMAATPSASPAGPEPSQPALATPASARPASGSPAPSGASAAPAPHSPVATPRPAPNPTPRPPEVKSTPKPPVKPEAKIISKPKPGPDLGF